MIFFNKQKKTEEQKSATYLMKHNFNRGLEERELGAFYERFCMFENSLEHYNLAYDFFLKAESFVSLAEEEEKGKRVSAYKTLTYAKVLDIREKMRDCGDGGRSL